MSVLLIGLLLAAEPSVVSRGDLLKQHQYQTYGDYALFVDPLGSDANACTATGANACLTIPGAVAKLPRVLRNNVVITVTGGSGSTPNTYGGFVVPQFQMDPALPAGAATGLNIVCNSYVLATLATGTATGTATSAASGSAAVFPFTLATLTDSTQTWTTNNLAGYMVQITSGAGAVTNNILPIVSNTGTQITVGTTAWATAVPSTATYNIIDWGCKITTYAKIPVGIGSTANTTGAGIAVIAPMGANSQLQIQIDSFRVNATLGAPITVAYGIFSANALTGVTFVRDRVDVSGQTNLGGVSVVGSGGSTTFSRCTFATTTTDVPLSQSGQKMLVSTSFFMSSLSSGQAINTSTGSISTSLSIVSFYKFATPVLLQSQGKFSLSTVRFFDYASAGISIVNSGSVNSIGATVESTGQIYFNTSTGGGTGYGMFINGNHLINIAAPFTMTGAGAGGTIALFATHGARVFISPTNSSVTGMANEVYVDDVGANAAGPLTTSTIATLNPCLTAVATGTSVCIP